MNELLSPIRDLIIERDKIIAKKTLYEKFQEKPDLIRGHINKAKIDINDYTTAIIELTNKLTNKELKLLEKTIPKEKLELELDKGE